MRRTHRAIVGKSSSGSRTLLISPTRLRSSASSSPGRAGLLFGRDGSGTRNASTPPPGAPRGGRSPGPSGVHWAFHGRRALKLPLELEDIKAILPHRYPFLLVDRVLELEEDKRVVAIKNITSNERYFIAGPGGVADPAGLDPHRGHGPGGGGPDPLQAREPLPARLLHGDRPRALPAPGHRRRPGATRGRGRAPAQQDRHPQGAGPSWTGRSCAKAR